MNPVPNWDIGILAGAGGLRSSANDMLTFLAANLGYTKTPLAAAMAAEIAIRHPVAPPEIEIAYNWFIQTKNGNSSIWHNGGTGGYRTYIAFDPKNRTGVVVLSNLSSEAGPDDIGRHLLDPTYPLLKTEAPKERKEITAAPSSLDQYVGAYQLAPSAIITVTREGDQLSVQLTGQPKFPLFQEAEGKFFLKVVDAQLTFDAPVTQVTLHQGGRDQIAPRISEAQATALLGAVEKRFKDQKQAPGSDAALRRTIEELRLGQPKYDSMTSGFADVTRRQLPQLQGGITQLGPVQSFSFKGVGQGGADIFEVKFEHGLTEWRISLDASGKIAGMTFRPL